MHCILGTAGHIDHGKSSLVKALTGIDPDRLPEEKKRGVTIELGFAHLTLSDKGKDHQVGIIDVPGHADFVNNMVAGVGSLDIAVFIVAADDGWMPQSEEHLHILNYLGVENVIIALTKADLAEDIEFTEELVRDELIGTSLEEATIIPVSSLTGEGIDTLKAEILTRIKLLKQSPKNLIPRLSVDRSFSPTGVGTVITGTLTGGNLSKRDTICCMPEKLTSNIRGIQNHSSQVETATHGMRTALNAPDLPLNERGKPGVQRGSVITLQDILTATSTLDISLTRQKRSIRGQSATKRQLKHTETVILHHGTSRTRARIILHSQTQLAPGESCYAQLRLESPITACVGDRFVIRDGAQQGTLGGGVILDALAEPRQFRSEARLRFLKLRAESPANLRQLILTEIQKSPILKTTKPIINSPFTRDYTEQQINKLIKEKKVTNRGDHIIDPAGWKSAIAIAEQVIISFHKKFPDTPTMPIEEWRNQLVEKSIHPSLSDHIEKHLLGNGYKKIKDGIASAEHSLELPEHLLAIADKILSMMKSSGLQPPPRVELADTAEAQQALTFLIRSGKVIELDPKALLETSQYEAAKQAVISYLTEVAKATASDIRQQIGTTRKVLMPLLERLDDEGITIRTDDYRSLKK
ncbi:MAG: selenocysteine-specific elongation factor [Rubritalea sp.]|jgi:selenocysteine-specific elongation factor|tara:strand:+ start:21641 stop:23560 length:1920 start_codon:yes stop_codon:yes gene_type:complete